MLDQTLDTIAPVDSVERESELSSIRSAEADIDKQYEDALFWRRIANIMAEALETKDDSIEGAITSSSHYLWNVQTIPVLCGML